MSALSLLFCVGCSDGRPPAFPARGKVVFPTGSPVHVGTVELKSREHGIQARGEIQNDGTFVLSTYREGDGAVAGFHDAVVVQIVVAEEVQGHRPSKLGVVHPRYARYATSGLEVEVKPAGGNELIIQVDGLVAVKPGDESKPHGH
ncbi:MAG: hypothetical protein U0892_12270 [Pirellulales bacterium]